MTSHFDALPSDLFAYFITNYFGISSEEEIDVVPLPASLIVLQMLEKRFYQCVMKEKSVTQLAVFNYRNQLGHSL